MASNLGELLLREKILSVDQLKSALDFQKKNSLPVGTSLVQIGLSDRGGHRPGPQPAAGLSLHRSRPVRRLRRGHQPHPGRRGQEVPGHADPPDPLLPDPGHGRPDRPRDHRGRPLPDGPVDPAGHRLGDGRRQRHQQVLRHGRRHPGQEDHRGHRAGRRRPRQHHRGREPDRRHDRVGQRRRRGPDHQAGQPDLHRRHQAGRERRPLRALRDELPRPLPHGRRPLRDRQPAPQVPQPGHLPRQDPVQHGHRREAPAPGRPHQDAPAPRQRQEEGGRHARLLPADPVGGEDRRPYPRQGDAQARPDPARLRGGAPGRLPGRHRQALGHRPGHRDRRAAARRTRSIRPSRPSTRRT